MGMRNGRNYHLLGLFLHFLYFSSTSAGSSVRQLPLWNWPNHIYFANRLLLSFFFFFFSCKHSSFQLHGLKENFILPSILMPTFACFMVFVLKLGKIFGLVSSGVWWIRKVLEPEMALTFGILKKWKEKLMLPLSKMSLLWMFESSVH